jgi:hypothetical protein
MYWDVSQCLAAARPTRAPAEDDGATLLFGRSQTQERDGSDPAFGGGLIPCTHTRRSRNDQIP